MNSICLAVLPGFGMQGSDFKIPVDDYFRVKTFDPPWNVCNSFASVATELAPWLNKWAGAQAQEDELVIYGFSVGADLLMAMLLTTTSPFLILPQKTLLILADPNISSETCFITGKASAPGCNSIDAFISIIQELTKEATNQEAREHWRRYLDAIKNNRDNLSWPCLKNTASTIVSRAEDRFRRILSKINDEGIFHESRKINIELSSDGYKEFAKLYPAKRNCKWVNSDSKMQHFNLSDPGQIRALVMAVIEKRRDGGFNK